MTPEQLWDWSRRSDWKTALRQGWLAALRDQPDVRWIALLQTMERDARAERCCRPAGPAEPAEREALWQAQLQQARAAWWTASTPSRAACRWLACFLNPCLSN
jgi:hypothetical protein